jgi:hypothetical protein
MHMGFAMRTHAFHSLDSPGTTVLFCLLQQGATAINRIAGDAARCGISASLSRTMAAPANLRKREAAHEARATARRQRSPRSP